MKGISRGLNYIIPKGGHSCLIPIVSARNEGK